jgi:hypothetical protein
MAANLAKARRQRFTWSLFVLLGVFIASLTFTGASLSQSQQAPTLRIVSEDGNRLPTIVITPNDIRNLPGGANYIGSPNGGIWKLTNDSGSFPLKESGGGGGSARRTLTLPGFTGKATRTKSGQGMLILTNSNDVVYEFRDLEAVEFDRVSVSVSSEQLTLNGPGFMGRYRPANAMNGWPFKRLLIVPVDHVAQFGTARGDKVKDTPRETKFSCESGFCHCNGDADCESLIKSASCVSQLNCDVSGSDVRCFCSAKMTLSLKK